MCASNEHAARRPCHRIDVEIWSDQELRGDLTSARGDDLHRYRDARLFVPDKTMVCPIGPEDPVVVLEAIALALGEIKPHTAAGPVRAAKVELHPGDHRATWDVDARHMLLTWPTVSVAEDAPAYAALAVAARAMCSRHLPHGDAGVAPYALRG